MDAEIPPSNLLIISDPGQDLDDELMILLLAALSDAHAVNCLGLVATLGPSEMRASLARGMLDRLGLQHVPVGIGSDGGSTGSTALMKEVAYLSSRDLEDGQTLMSRVLARAEDHSVSILVVASHRDLMSLMMADEALFVRKVKEVVSMGGVLVNEAEVCPLTPDSAHNNTFDMDASKYMYARCQALGVPLIIASRFVAYTCQLPKTLYDRMARMATPISMHLQGVQQEAIEQLWMRACAPEGSGKRAGLPARCDREWFCKTFCGCGAGEIGEGEPIWDRVLGFNMYDPIALLAATPAMQHLFTFATFDVGGTSHRVAGLSADSPGIHPQVEQLMAKGFIAGLKAEKRQMRASRSSFSSFGALDEASSMGRRSGNDRDSEWSRSFSPSAGQGRSSPQLSSSPLSTGSVPSAARSVRTRSPWSPAARASDRERSSVHSSEASSGRDETAPPEMTLATSPAGSHPAYRAGIKTGRRISALPRALANSVTLALQDAADIFADAIDPIRKPSTSPPSDAALAVMEALRIAREKEASALHERFEGTRQHRYDADARLSSSLLPPEAIGESSDPSTCLEA